MNPYLKDIQRLQDLLALKILDTPEEEYLNDLAQLTSIICNTPVALISFIDDKRQWYKAKIGTSAIEVPVEETICQYTLVQQDILEFEDTWNERLLDSNPHVHSENAVRFYAGINLYSENGHAIGTICTVNLKPQKLDDNQKESLRIIAKQVMLHLNKNKENDSLRNELKLLVDEKIEFAERQLKVQEQAYNNLYNAIEKSNAVIEFDPEGIVINVNNNFLDIFGYKKNELIGQENTILLDEEDLAQYEKFWEKLKSGISQSGKFKRVTKSGETIWIQASYSPVLDFEGNLVKITKIAQDITAEVATQKSLGLAKQLADELNVQKDNFIANMSHELRTPLNAIVGFSDLLFHQEQDSKKLQYLSAIKSASDSLLYLVNDILDLSKIESGIIQFDKTSFSVKDVVEDVFNVLGLKAKQKGISFKFYICNAVPKYVIGDKNRLVQVLNNLLNNAIKFTQEGSVMLFVDAIRTQSNELQLHFSVEDTGIGIPKDKLKTIFNRFTQAESSTTRLYGGTGLGLNISQLIVERQGGTLGVESEYNKGSKFWFVLPFDEIDEENQTFEIFENLSVDSYSAKILICEDNELNRILMDSIFKETDFEIEFAENGLQALDLVKEKSFDLILMDLHMPFMDGYETVKIIRQELQLLMPIIALTANSLIKEKEVCLALGMNDYLAKPFKTNELLTKIVNLLEVEGKQKTISLEALEEYSGGNIAFQKQMIELFLETSEKEIQKMNAFLNQESLKEASQVVHKLKSSLGILGVDLALAQDFENELIQANDSKKIESCKTVFLEQLQQIRKELIQILKSE